MKIPKYWANSMQVVRDPAGRALRLASWQWSDASLAEARQRADERISELARKVAAGEQLNRYGYGERPLREEIAEGVRNGAGHEVGIVTRNQYGARILNAVNAMFIDIDFAGQDMPDPGTQPPAATVERYVQRVTGWAERHSDLGLRVYRTFGGLRVLITSDVFDPGSADAVRILRELGSDPLYVRLCQAQACFRARVTPKPWRCRMATPPSTYPWADYPAEMRYRDWERRYEHAARAFAACRFVARLGPDRLHPDIEPVLALHDEVACSPGDRPLA